MHKGSQCVQKYKYTMIIPTAVVVASAFMWGSVKYYKNMIQNIQALKVAKDLKKIVEKAKTLKSFHKNDITEMSDTSIPKFNVIIDVRTKEEYDHGHYKNAINIPYTEFLPPDTNLPSFVLLSQKIIPEDNILLYCRTGYRSRQVLKVLEKENIFKDRVYFTTNPYTKMQL